MTTKTWTAITRNVVVVLTSQSGSSGYDISSWASWPDWRLLYSSRSLYLTESIGSDLKRIYDHGFHTYRNDRRTSQLWSTISSFIHCCIVMTLACPKLQYGVRYSYNVGEGFLVARQSRVVPSVINAKIRILAYEAHEIGKLESWLSTTIYEKGMFIGQALWTPVDSIALMFVLVSIRPVRSTCTLLYAANSAQWL